MTFTEDRLRLGSCRFCAHLGRPLQVCLALGKPGGVSATCGNSVHHEHATERGGEPWAALPPSDQWSPSVREAFGCGVIPLEAGSLTKPWAVRPLRTHIPAIAVGGLSSTVPGSGLTPSPQRYLGCAETGSERHQGLWGGPLRGPSALRLGLCLCSAGARGGPGTEPPPAGSPGVPAGHCLWGNEHRTDLSRHSTLAALGWPLRLSLPAGKWSRSSR